MSLSFDDLPVGQKWEPPTRTDIEPRVTPKISPRGQAPVEKRTFLKRGARMPVSKLPGEPSETVVEPIKNPPSRPKTNENRPSQSDSDMVYSKPVKSGKKQLVPLKPSSITNFRPFSTEEEPIRRMSNTPQVRLPVDRWDSSGFASARGPPA